MVGEYASAVVGEERVRDVDVRTAFLSGDGCALCDVAEVDVVDVGSSTYHPERGSTLPVRSKGVLDGDVR